LEDAVTMLAEGGRLVYSTCTWAPEENEEIVHWLLDTYDFELLPVEHVNGMVAGINLPETARMYPHHFKGEGQFVAHLQFKGENPAAKFKASKTNLSREQLALWREFAQKHLKVTLTGLLQTFGDQLYLLPEMLPDLGKLKIARNGLHLGTFKKKRFEPSFALGLALKPSQVKQSVEI
ncbi:RsmF rRNA methyltransferase first C-terminal domain-containing protein, partial [Streptococcus sanguinis]